MTSDLLNRIQTAQTHAAEDVVIASLKAQGFDVGDADNAKKPPTDSELPNRGPRVTPADVEAEIEREDYINAGTATRSVGGPLNLLTFCVLTLRNGFTVTGESACAAPENFDAEIGKRIARQAAVAKVWPLLGFRLRDHLTGMAAVKALACEEPPAEAAGA